MSTTFGVKIPRDFSNSLQNYVYPEIEYHNDDAFAIVARRSNRIYFLSPIALLLEDSLAVFALDNTQQGIFTIGDIKKQIKKQENG